MSGSALEYRVVILGAGGTGKSALTVRFIQGTFVVNYDPTIEDSYRKQVEVDHKQCIIDVMDTAGQDEYSALRDSYLKTGEGFVLVYSITSANSFEQAAKLRTHILRIKEDIPDIPIMLVGNKLDKEEERQISSEAGRKQAEKWEAGFIESSAKLPKHVNEVFAGIVRLINKWREKHPSGAGGLRRSRRLTNGDGSGGGGFFKSCVLL